MGGWKEDDPFLLGFGKSSGAFPVKPSGGFFQRSSDQFMLLTCTLLKLTANSPENRLSRKEISPSNHPFSGAFAVSLREFSLYRG